MVVVHSAVDHLALPDIYFILEIYTQFKVTPHETPHSNCGTLKLLHF